MLSSLLIKYNECLNVGNQVILVWCPAHVEIKGNEQIDGVARAGLGLDRITEEIPHSPTEIYSKIKTFIKTSWKKLIQTKPFKNTIKLMK